MSLQSVPVEGIPVSVSNPDLKASESCTGPISPRTTVAREAGSKQGGVKAMAGSYFEEVFMPAKNRTLRTVTRSKGEDAGMSAQ